VAVVNHLGFERNRTMTRDIATITATTSAWKPRPRARRSPSIVPVLLALLAAAVLAVVGGAYAWSTFPTLFAAAVLFLVSGARVCADPMTRRLDVALLAALGVVALQMAPLPEAVIMAISPATRTLQNSYALEPFNGWRPLSIHPAATRTAFALALAGAFVFWAAREAFKRSGTRATIPVLAWVGFGCSIVALAQRATAPRTIYWVWNAADPRALPFGPFIDRNHLATWLVLTLGVVGGYVAMRATSHMQERGEQGERAMASAVLERDATGLVPCLGAMLVTLAATVSPSGLLALFASVIIAAILAGVGRRRPVSLVAAAGVAVVFIAAWINGEWLVQPVPGTLDATPIGRLAIWRDTLPIIRDFPMLGTGAGTFADAMLMYQRGDRQVLFNQAHNEYLQLFTEGGAALLLAVVATLLLLHRVVHARLADDHGPHRLIRIGAYAALAGVAVQCFWDTPLHQPANLLLAAILAAVAVRPNRSFDAGANVPPP
jgi:O-antigen ligase